MLYYKLSRLAERRRGTVVVLPAIEERLSAVLGYRRVLVSMLREIGAETRRSVLPVYQEELRRTRAQQAVTLDMAEETFTSVSQLANRLAQVAARLVRDILDLEAEQHSKQFIETVKRAIGVDLQAVIRDEDLADYLDTAAARNAGLIRDLSSDAVKRVKTTVTTALINGTPRHKLRKDLTRQFQFAKSRADLIAQDQVAKLNSDLNRLRHQQADIRRYKWSTSLDERVRPRHRALEGKVYAYGEPTGAEEGLPPGQPIRCRCVARAVVQF